MSETMRALRIHETGSPLRDDLVPAADPGPGEVLIRIKASGICHSDVHYRDGTAPPAFLPIIPGHEVAGIIEGVGTGVPSNRVGERVAVHYMESCGDCFQCARGTEQFCPKARMVGKFRDGGYAELISVASRNAVRLPDSVGFAAGAVMMCSTATSFHALKKARLSVGERVAVFGAGGLGMSAVQLARIFGAREVFAVDIDPARLAIAEGLGAVPVNASKHDPVTRIRSLTGGNGVDVAVELIGLPRTIEQTIDVLGVQGRAALVGIGTKPVSVDTYGKLIGREAEIIGVSDHLLSELPLLLDFAARGMLDFSGILTRTVALDARAVNDALDELAAFGSGGVRTVIVP